MADNLLVVHGGGPTAVINASLYGVIREAKKNPSIGKVLGAIGGTGAIFTEQFLDLTAFSDEKLKLLLHTPASATDHPDIRCMKKIMRRCLRFSRNTISVMFF